MAKAVAALVAASFLILLLAFPTVFATDYVVGGPSGWVIGPDYGIWAENFKFKVNDTLTFKYEARLHQVEEVSKSDYINCNSNHPIKNYKGGNNKITLSKPGSYFFLCPTPRHCQLGMKLALSVS
ncbi:hypothetical protein HN51_027304 [Arachis hypogaea]|uniref:Phytocyanin domain-containing protein n=1 Tax=Arachis hypogaea TaxID=3818 RepID=A0A445BNM9_ARAHY|nr:mavicyanin-like [Arachis hypogaea]QHO33633.1 Blue copper protein [Arachis hypogaea]RYR40262.1 hypothetical protein Ahy_A09g045987 [Arachis hypogaea]